MLLARAIMLHLLEQMSLVSSHTCLAWMSVQESIVYALTSFEGLLPKSRRHVCCMSIMYLFLGHKQPRLCIMPVVLLPAGDTQPLPDAGTSLAGPPTAATDEPGEFSHLSGLDVSSRKLLCKQ